MSRRMTTAGAKSIGTITPVVTATIGGLIRHRSGLVAGSPRTTRDTATAAMVAIIQPSWRTAYPQRFGRDRTGPSA
ncbi:hypothetical protein ACIRRA_00995 [Nocardia sp. NPDC101769]|uniref:hypothetical protein n=1 Tax=Nocardia sp. NPDC101769 TaxID=3364333 RepID=UPI00380BABB9